MSEALKNLKIVPGSKIVFFKNGESQGEAFVDINAGAYYPAISIFKNATVSVNFGPNFKHPEIEDEFKCKGVSKSWIFRIASRLIGFFFSHFPSGRCTIVLKNSFVNNRWPT